MTYGKLLRIRRNAVQRQPEDLSERTPLAFRVAGIAACGFSPKHFTRTKLKTLHNKRKPLMEYHGKLYGKMGNKIFPLTITTDDIDQLRKKISENVPLEKMAPLHRHQYLYGLGLLAYKNLKDK